MQITPGFSPAIEQTKKLLFRPFNAGAWLSLGLMIFLASLVDSATIPNLNIKLPGRSSSAASGIDVSELLKPVRAWVHDHASLGLPILLGGAALFIPFTIGLVWLGTRAQLMVLRAVAENDTIFGSNWVATGPSAWRLFRLRLLLAAIDTIANLALLALVVRRVLELADAGVADPYDYVKKLVPLIFVTIAMLFVQSLIDFAIRHFVAPLMLRFDLSWTDGVRAFFTILSGNFPQMVGYLFLRALLAVGIGVAAGFIGVITCCVGTLPVLAQVFAAPLHVFDRAYTLYVIQSLGPAYQMIAPDPPPPVYPQYQESPYPQAPPPQQGGFSGGFSQ
jgi:hypothetical protein